MTCWSNFRQAWSGVVDRRFRNPIENAKNGQALANVYQTAVQQWSNMTNTWSQTTDQYIRQTWFNTMDQTYPNMAKHWPTFDQHILEH